MERESKSPEELMLVRDVLAREVETINTYQASLGKAESESVRTFLSHIIDEEKEHVAEALELIKEMDPTQAALLQAARTSHDIANQRPSATKPVKRPGTTVGSLRTGHIRD